MKRMDVYIVVILLITILPGCRSRKITQGKQAVAVEAIDSFRLSHREDTYYIRQLLSGFSYGYLYEQTVWSTPDTAGIQYKLQETRLTGLLSRQEKEEIRKETNTVLDIEKVSDHTYVLEESFKEKERTTWYHKVVLYLVLFLVILLIVKFLLRK